MKKTKIMILGTLVMLLVASSVSINVAGKILNSKTIQQSNIGADIDIEHAITDNWGQVYIPDGKIIRNEDHKKGFNGLAKAYDEEYMVSAAYSLNKASGKLIDGSPSLTSIKTIPNGISLDHRNLQAAGQLKPMDKSACAMGTTGTDVSFIPTADHNGMIRMKISIDYSLMVSATEDFRGQTIVSVIYYDNFNDDSFEFTKMIHLTQAGSEGISDTVDYEIEVPSGTLCNINVGTGGTSGSLQQEDVTGMCQALADISVTITVR